MCCWSATRQTTLHGKNVPKESKMWGVVASVATVVLGACITRRRRSPPSEPRSPRQVRRGASHVAAQLQAVETIDELVVVMRNIGTEVQDGDSMADALDVAVRQHGLTEGALMRLSRLHQVHGSDLGTRGYAVQVCWSSVSHAHAQTWPREERRMRAVRFPKSPRRKK